jgi:type I restriction enzyme, S subunit
MNAETLRNSILQLAISGKLVEQREEEGTAEELYQQIVKEKEQLIKEGRIKKSKPLPPIQPEEIPFGIPSSWMWVRLRNVASINAGYSFKSHNLKRDGVRVIRISDFDSNGFLDKSIVKHEFSSKLSNFTIKSKDILVCMTGGTVGKSLLVPEINEQLYLNQRIGRISSLRKVSPNFIDAVIKSNVTQENIKKSITSTNDNISMTMLEEILVPLPPLFEQLRIVEKVEELLPLVEKYGEANSRLESLNSKFPDEIKQSILQYAIQGKLVEQREEEGTAEDLYRQILKEKEQLYKEGRIKKPKPLPPIQPEEIPFEIPPSWKWFRFDSISDLKTGNSISETDKKNIYKDVKYGHSYIATSNVGFDGTIDYDSGLKIPIENENFRIAEAGDTLLCIEGASAGRKIGLLDKSVCFGNKLCSFHVNKYNNKLFYYYLQSEQFRSLFNLNKTGIIGGVSINKLRHALIPLPPLLEQQRIVEKIEEFMQLVNELKGEVS